jgi:hypothetical protein
MASETTSLSNLPNNTESDSDLVNKILNQLDTSNEVDTPPSFEIEKPPDTPVSISIDKQQPVEAAQLSEPVIRTRVSEYKPSPIQSPENISNILKVMDINYIYKAGKISLAISILFFLFIQFTDSFTKIFRKIPYIKATFGDDFNVCGLNNTGKILQSICFGIVYFFLKLFFP